MAVALALPSEVLIACATVALIVAMSGWLVSTSGGTKETVRTGDWRALRASCMNVSTSLPGTSVVIRAWLALAMSSNLSTTVFGLSWCSMAFITHFWRAIRE